jgi:hypothetical protein
MRKRIGFLVASVLLVLGLMAGPAAADPAFGPGGQGGGEGNSAPNGPADPKCHPPGQTVEEPGC